MPLLLYWHSLFSSSYVSKDSPPQRPQSFIQFHRIVPPRSYLAIAVYRLVGTMGSHFRLYRLHPVWLCGNINFITNRHYEGPRSRSFMPAVFVVRGDCVYWHVLDPHCSIYVFYCCVVRFKLFIADLRPNLIFLYVTMQRSDTKL